MDRLRGTERSGLLRRTAEGLGAVLLGAGLAATLAACGDAPGGQETPAAATTSTSAPSVPVAAHRYPPCADIWRAGQHLPAGYEGCRADGTVIHDRRRSCSSGQVIVVHRPRWYAVTRGPVNRIAGDHPARRMRSLLRSCTG